jgi:hypothetical protein
MRDTNLLVAVLAVVVFAIAAVIYIVMEARKSVRADPNESDGWLRTEDLSDDELFR